MVKVNEELVDNIVNELVQRNIYRYNDIEDPTLRRAAWLFIKSRYIDYNAFDYMLLETARLLSDLPKEEKKAPLNSIGELLAENEELQKEIANEKKRRMKYEDLYETWLRRAGDSHASYVEATTKNTKLEEENRILRDKIDNWDNCFTNKHKIIPAYDSSEASPKWYLSTIALMLGVDIIVMAIILAIVL